MFYRLLSLFSKFIYFIVQSKRKFCVEVVHRFEHRNFEIDFFEFIHVHDCYNGKRKAHN